MLALSPVRKTESEAKIDVTFWLTATVAEAEMTLGRESTT